MQLVAADRLFFTNSLQVAGAFMIFYAFFVSVVHNFTPIVGFSVQFTIAVMSVAILSGCEKPISPKPSLPVDLYIAGGQSNMVGYGAFVEQRHMQKSPNVLYQFRAKPGAEAPEWSQVPRYFRHGSIFRDLGNLRLRGVGLWWSFSRRIAGVQQESEIRILMLAVNGSTLHQWTREGEFYDENLRLVKSAITDGAVLKGMIWHQGESGTGVPEADYGEMFTGFVESLRSDLEQPNLPVVAGKLDGNAPNAETVNPALDRLAQSLPRFAVVDVPDKTLSDKVHFDTKTSERLGVAMAEAMLQLQASTVKTQ